MSFIFSPEYHVKGFIVSALRPIVYLIFHVPVCLKHNHASLSKYTLIVSMDGHIQGMQTTQRAKIILWWLSTVWSEMWTRELYFQLSTQSYLYVLFQLCMAGADHAHAGLPLQLALLIVVGYTRGQTHATSCRTFTPFSGLNDTVVSCALRLDTLISYFSICWKKRKRMLNSCASANNMKFKAYCHAEQLVK